MREGPDRNWRDLDDGLAHKLTVHPHFVEEIEGAVHRWRKDFSFPEPKAHIVSVVEELGSRLQGKSGQPVGVHANQVRIVEIRASIVPRTALPAGRLRHELRGALFARFPDGLVHQTAGLS